MDDYELAVRWSDLDPNRHVNNIVYVRYCVEAQAALAESGALPGGPVASIAVQYTRPLTLTRSPVRVTGTLDGDELVQEVVVDRDGTPVVHARVTTTYGDTELPPRPDPGAVVSDCRLRRADLDTGGGAAATALLELVQEGRHAFWTRHREAFPPGALVLGRTTLVLGAPMAWRTTPFEVRTWISKATAALVMMDSEIVDGDVVHARVSSVHVPFDVETQRSRKLTPEERELLASLVVVPAPE